MSTKVTRQQRDDERRETLAQVAVLDVVRHLLRSGASHVDACATLVALAQEAERLADRHAHDAIAEGESYAEVARALDVSRQAATKRYRHLRVV